MRLGQLTQIKVPETGLLLLVRVKWGEYKKLAKQISEKDELEALEDIDQFLRTIIADCRGLEDTDGQPLKWTPEVLDELDPATVMACFKALMNIGEAGSGDPLPATASEASSEAPPPS